MQEAGVYGKSLHLSLNFAVNLKLSLIKSFKNHIKVQTLKKNKPCKLRMISDVTTNGICDADL